MPEERDVDWLRLFKIWNWRHTVVMVVMAVVTAVAISNRGAAAQEGAPPCNEVLCQNCRTALYYCEEQRAVAKATVGGGLAVFLGGLALSTTGIGAPAGAYIAGAGVGIALGGAYVLWTTECKPCFTECWGCPTQSSAYG